MFQMTRPVIASVPVSLCFAHHDGHRRLSRLVQLSFLHRSRSRLQPRSVLHLLPFCGRHSLRGSAHQAARRCTPVDQRPPRRGSVQYPRRSAFSLHREAQSRLAQGPAYQSRQGCPARGRGGAQSVLGQDDDALQSRQREKRRRPQELPSPVGIRGAFSLSVQRSFGPGWGADVNRHREKKAFETEV